jgi:hypothetical protein
MAIMILYWSDTVLTYIYIYVTVVFAGPISAVLNDSEPLCELCKALEEADVNISFDWSGYSSKEDAVDPMIVDAVDHTQVNYLDPDMSLKADIVTGNGFKSIFSPFRKPGMHMHTSHSTHSMLGTHSVGGFWQSYCGS